MKVALVCVAKNEDLYIQEWIDYNLKLGFDDIIIFQHEWNYEIKHPKVKTYKIIGENIQVPTYNHFLKNYEGMYDWAAFFDVDEYLVLKKHNNIKSFISDYSMFNNIAINWVLFGDNNIGEFSESDSSVVNRFTKRQQLINRHVKTISKVSSKYTFVTPHNTETMWVSPDNKLGSGPFNPEGKDEVAQINHYFCKTKIEFEEKIKRGRADTKKGQGIRTWQDFDNHNFNEVEDLSAKNFFNSVV
jgi:hypothetical protein